MKKELWGGGRVSLGCGRMKEGREGGNGEGGMGGGLPDLLR